MTTTQQNGGLQAKISEYYAAREEYERQREIAKELEKRMRAKEMTVIDGMISAGIRSITLADGTRPTLAKQVSCSVTQDNSDDIRAWLMEKLGDDKDFVTANRFRVANYIKEQINEHGASEDDFPDFMKVSTRPSLRVTGWRGKSDYDEVPF